MAKKTNGLSVSVALATYNGERFLREQLESIQGQSVLPQEIVISDDTSQDSTVALVGEVLTPAWCDSQGVALRVIRNTKALGPGKNFEQAILACSGDLVVLADQDDLWHQNKVERLLAEFVGKPQVLLVHSDARLVDGAGQPLGMRLSDGVGFSAEEFEILASGHSLPALIKRNLATGAAMMFRRELANLAFPLPKGELHDGWLALAASLLDGVVFVPEELIDYRQHGKNEIGGEPKDARAVVETLLGSWVVLRSRLSQKNSDTTLLVERMGDRVSQRNREIIDSRLRHNEWRIGLPKSRLLRVWPVLAGVLAGRYHKYGRVPHDVLRDLVMPPRDLLLGFLRFLVRKS
jgi:glycosyltransferase involved in cell wall biosynthesis